MLPQEKDEAGMPVTVRAVFILNPEKKVALTITYPPAVGRNFKEVLRVVDALQRAAKHPVATPVDWTVVRAASRNTSPHFTHAACALAG